METAAWTLVAGLVSGLVVIALKEPTLYRRQLAYWVAIPSFFAFLLMIIWNSAVDRAEYVAIAVPPNIHEFNDTEVIKSNIERAFLPTTAVVVAVFLGFFALILVSLASAVEKYRK